MTSSSRPADARSKGHVGHAVVQAVQQQGVTGAGAQRRGLVHATGRGAGDLVLGLDARCCQPGPARCRRPRAPGRARRPGRSPPRTRGQPRTTARRRRGRRSPRRRRSRRHPSRPGAVPRRGPCRVGDPPGHCARGDVAHGAGPDRMRVQGGHQPDAVVVAGAQGDEGAVRQRDRQAGSAVVVQVLPDQVDPTGGGPDAVGLPVESAGEQGHGPVGTLVVGPRRVHSRQRWDLIRGHDSVGPRSGVATKDTVAAAAPRSSSRMSSLRARLDQRVRGRRGCASGWPRCSARGGTR